MLRKLLERLLAALVLAAGFLISACGGGGAGTQVSNNEASLYVTGVISNLNDNGLILQYNLANNLAPAIGTQGFKYGPVAQGTQYSITVESQPGWQWCNVGNPSGSISGNVSNITVSCVDAVASVSTIAGSDSQGSSDGTASTASFYAPGAIIGDGNGNYYIADSGSSIIRKMTSTGVVTTIPGIYLTLVDPTIPSDSSVNYTGMALDTLANVLYVSEPFYGKVVAINLASYTSTDYATGLNIPQGLALDASGSLYIAETGKCRIVKVGLTGVVPFAGGGSSGNCPPVEGASAFGDGEGVAAGFKAPVGLAIDTTGNIYVTDANYIREIDSAGTVKTISGTSESGSIDGPEVSASFSAPQGIAVDSNENVFIAEGDIRMINNKGVVSTILNAGTNGLHSVYVGTDDSLWSADLSTIRRLVAASPS
jgi:hypothetical protein